MITKHKHKKLIWIDVESPVKEDVLELVDQYGLDPAMANEVITPTLRDKIDLHKNIIYLVLHFPKSQSSGYESREHEIDFILGKTFMITVHYGPINSVYEFSKLLETNSILKSNETKHAGFLFYYLIHEFYRNSTDKILDIGNNLKLIEKKIFDGKEGEMVQALSNLNRKLIDFKQATHLHSDILKTLEDAGSKFFGTDFRHYLTTISSEYNKAQNILDNQKSILNDLRQTNDSLLSMKTGHAMKTLSMVSFVIFPLTLIAGIFGMNTKDMPLIGARYDFWIIIAIMAMAVVLMFTFFKKKKWI